MAEKVVSPGVFTKEIDASFLPAAIGDIGAVVVGPTVKGPFMIPTVVNSFSEYQAKFGDTFKSGSGYHQFLTSHTAQNYLKHGSRLTIVRIPNVSSYGAAKAQVEKSHSAADSANANAVANGRDGGGAFTLFTLTDGADMNSTGSQGVGGILVSESVASNKGTGGTKDNVRYEISSVNENKGTYTLLIRRGDDIHKRKQILETWNNLSSDPNASNYIKKVIGDQKFVLRGSGESEPFLQLSGSFPNKSKYVRVDNVNKTVDYLDENGNVRDTGAKANLPGVHSGSFFGGVGGNVDGFAHPAAMHQLISATNIQGLTYADATDHYTDALNMLKNQDEYDFNLLMLPGITGNQHTAVASKAIDICESRGDAFYIMDAAGYGAAITTATGEAEGRDSNYAGTYFPWVQVPDTLLGKNVWVPPSTVLGGIYAFNDKVAHPWFAPAGLNRGGIDTAIQAERKLTNANRDTLYESNVNPIATFPGQGVCVWGQKTMQKKASALDRINVRRLMIKVKKFIASSSRFLLFEQNTPALRKRFLNIANPYLEQVQAQSGLSAFRVVMDESNNPPDLVDRNILYGQIFLQPTKTAEFIILDFTIQPTGATFPE